MTKSIKCPQPGCERKFTTENFVKRHCEVMHKSEPEETLRRKGWVTPYGFGDFKEPITYQEACDAMKVITEAMQHRTFKP